MLKRKERLKGESRSMGQTTLELVDVERGIEQMKKMGAFPPFFLLSESINEGKIWIYKFIKEATCLNDVECVSKIRMVSHRR